MSTPSPYPGVTPATPSLCPACGVTSIAMLRPRPPLDLYFCSSCGMLIGAQEQGTRIELLPEPAPAPTTAPSAPAEPAGSLQIPPPPAATPPLRLPPPGTQAENGDSSEMTSPGMATPGELPRPAEFLFPRILIGDPQLEFRNMIQGLLVGGGVTEEVMLARDGAQLLTEFTRSCREGNPPTLVVLEASMPLLDGKNAAILLRSVEDAFSRTPSQIVFFTSQDQEAGLQQLLNYLKNARFFARDPAAGVEVQARSLLQQIRKARWA